jgi:carboxyl-terminal processing protease
VFTDASGAEQQIALSFEKSPLGITQMGNLPPFPIEVESRRVEVPVDGAKPVAIGIISFNIWMTGASDAIDRAVDSLRNCDGIVLDLRGNPGGLGAMSMGVAGHFLKEPASLGSMIGRESTLEFKAEPRKVSPDGKRVRPYATKPLAIVVDGRTASTSEVFAAGLQDLGRARVFGETSAGMALPALASELPNGEVLLHAVADFVTAKGTRIEGRGVIPDETVVPDRALLLKGEDPAVSAAMKWIGGRTIEARTARANSPTSSSATVPGLVPAAMPTAMPSAMPSAAAP